MPAIALCAAVAAALRPAAGSADGIGRAASPELFPTAAAQARALVADINERRRAHGVRPVRRARALSAAASAHSREMATFGFFAHTSLDGSPFWRRVLRFYKPRKREWSVGEAIAYSVGELDSDGVVDGWLASPGHRRVLLDAEWRDVGLGLVEAYAAPGVYAGQDVVVITADFGVR